MIKRVHIMSLKSIKDMTVECAKLNLLTGTNSSGKSTFIQALLMLEQCDLNGRYVSIGEFREAKNYNAPSAAISIEAWLDNEEEPVQVLSRPIYGAYGRGFTGEASEHVLSPAFERKVGVITIGDKEANHDTE